MNIGLIGYGALGVQIENILFEIGIKKDQIIYFDDFIPKRNNVFSFNSYLKKQFEDVCFIVCLGYKHLALKKEILGKLLDNGRNLYQLIHKTSYVNATSSIGKGVVIYPNCNIDYKVIINDGALINNSVTISHESKIGSSTYIAPGVIVNGNVNIGECSFIGSGTIISNNINIGKNAVVGISSCITNSLPDNIKCIGNPLRIIKEIDIH